MRSRRRAILLFATLLATAAHAAEPPLRPGEARTLALSASGKAELELAVAPGSAYVLETTEQGVDVRVDLVDGARGLRGFDGDILRLGHFRIAAAGAGAKPPRVTISGTRPGSPDGKVQVAVAALPKDDAAAAARFALDLLETDTAQRFYDAKLAKEPDSVDQARRLVAGRRESGPQRDLARAYLLLDQALMKQLRYDEAIATLEQALTVFRALGDRSGEASVLNDIGMHYWRKGEGSRSAAPLAAGLELATAAGDALLKALIKSNLCNIELSRGAVADSVSCTRTALAWSEETGDLARIATSWNVLGGAYSLTGQPRQAIAAFDRSAELRERSGGRPGPAQPIANAGLELQALGRFDEAEQRFLRAEALTVAEGDERQRAIVLRYRGQLRTLLGSHAEAAPMLEEALALQRRIGQRDDLLLTLVQLGDAQRLRDGSGKVPAALLEALELAERDGNPTLLADALARVAQVHVDGGREGEAAPLLIRAAACAEKVADVSVRARVTSLRARAALVAGRYAEAEALAKEAWAVWNKGSVAVRAAEASGIAGEALSSRGRYRDALPLFARGAAEIMHARAEITNPESRARFFATQRRLHEGHVGALAEIALSSGRASDVRRALAVSDRYRAQVLAEMLADRASGPARSDDPELAALREKEAALSAARWRLAESGAPAATREAVARSLADTSAELARRHKAAPEGEAAPERGLTRIPEGLTAVEFFATPSRAYAWIATSGGVAIKRLRGDATLAPLVERARAAVTSRDSVSDWSVPLADLCDAAWQPLADSISTERVALVLDGVLQHAPWPALRCADASGERGALVERFELVQLPSLRSLSSAPRAPAGSAADAALAVVDPVYERGDLRLGALADASRPAAPTDQLALRGRNLVRLGATHDEAALLERLMGAGKVRVLEGFGAERDAVLAGLAQPVRLVHFGTHGVVSGDDLAGTGLVLSLLDQAAHQREGFVSAREIARLDVRADLVVIAACDSGRGAEVAGEGLQSLAYGFLAAGARTVVAASWPVADAPTSRLMAGFYQALVDAGQRPAAAMRSAQLAMSRSAYWRHPGFWAGFNVTANSLSEPTSPR